MLHLVYGTNSPLIFASHVRHSPSLSPITNGRSSSSSSPSSQSPLASSLSHSVFHSERKTWLFSKSFPPQTFSFHTGLIPWTLGPFNVFILLNGWICLHGVLDKASSKSVFERTLNHCTFHFISYRRQCREVCIQQGVSAIADPTV